MSNNEFSGLTTFYGNIDLNSNQLQNVVIASSTNSNDFYETSTLSTTLTGDITPSPITINLKLSRMGNCITMSFYDVIPVTATGTGSLLVSSGVIDANFRPANNIYAPINVINAGIYQTGLMLVNSSGLVIFYSTTARSDFTGSSAVSICGSSISWNI